MPLPSSSSSRARRWTSGPDAVERLYVYWMVSTALLVLVALVAIILTRGMLARQTEALTKLEQRVTALEAKAHQPEPVVTPSVEKLPAAPPPPATIAPPRPPAEPAPTTTQPTDRASTAPGAEALDAQLAVLLTQAQRGLVADSAAADRLLELATRHAGAADWPPATWARLATLARLRVQDELAETFGERAADAGPEFLQYLEISTRSLLYRGAIDAARRSAQRFHDESDGQPASRLLLAATLVAGGNLAAADEVLENLPDVTQLSLADRLLLARLLLHLERGRRLEELLNQVAEVPPELAAEHAFLSAVALVGAGRTVEALAILDWLAAQPTTELEVETDSSAGWPLPRPVRYEVHVWRGVALMYAQQMEAARGALNYAISLDRQRPEAVYYLGVLEARAGRRQIAETYLRNLLTSTPDYAPACEALALLEMEDGRISLAMEHLRQALASNGRRAGAYFLLAVAYARISQMEPAADALRQAFRLDPAYLEEALNTPPLLRLFTTENLRLLATEPVAPEVPLPAEPPADRSADR